MDIVLKMGWSEMYIRSTETLSPTFFLHLATKMVAARDSLSVGDWRSFSREFDKSKRKKKTKQQQPRTLISGIH